MEKPASKLFDDPAEARRALDALQAAGYEPALGLVVRDQAQLRQLLGQWLASAGSLEVPRVGKVLCSGVARDAAGDGDGDGAERLAALLGVDATVFAPYYESGLRRGGALVVVQVAGERRKAARAILAAAADLTGEFRDGRANSPGFVNTERATDTNEADGRLSGDFRKY